MSEILPFILVGLVSGSVYALAGAGLVLTYKTSGVFNFAHGALATISAYLFYTLLVTHHVPWSLAAVLSVFVAGPLMGLGMAGLARAVRESGLVINVGSTVGVLLLACPRRCRSSCCSRCSSCTPTGSACPSGSPARARSGSRP